MASLTRRTAVYALHTITSIGLLAFLLIAFWAASYTLSVHRRHQAERLLQNLADLPPSESDDSAIRRMANDFSVTPHCKDGLCSYDFQEGFAYSNSWALRVMRRTEWDYVGLRPWQLTAQIETKDGKVTDISFRAVVGRGRGWLYNDGLFSGNMWAWLMVSVNTNTQLFEQNVRLQKEYAGAQAVKTGYQITAGDNGIIVNKPNLDTPGSGEVLSVNLPLGAPPKSRKIAFDINLRCITANSPCTELCQFAPSAWRTYSQFQKSNGWYVEEPAPCMPDPH